MTFIRRPTLAPLAVAAFVLMAGCSRPEAPPGARSASAPVTVDGTAAPASAAAPATAVAAARAAAGAGVPGERGAAAAPTSSGPSAAPAPAAPPVDGKPPLKVAFAYVGPVGDGGWTFAHDRARKAIDASFGGRVSTTFVENVPDNAEAERALRDLVAQGNRLIFGTAFGYGETMARLASAYPDVRWEHANGNRSADNLRAYGSRLDQGAYLAGIIAGTVTRTDTLGFVASIAIPEVIRNINAFTLGAQSVNPSVRTKVVWVNKWFDPGRESEAAQALINGGADVLLQSTDSSAPLQVAERAGKYGFGWASNMKAYGPKAHLASVTVDWTPYYRKAVGQVLDGSWKPETHRWGLREGAVDLVAIADGVPGDVRTLVEEKKKAIADGSFRIWKGPMLTSEDKEVLPTGAVADDAFIGAMMFYVKGVEGQVPSGT